MPFPSKFCWPWSLCNRVADLERKVQSLEIQLAAIQTNSVLALSGHLRLDTSGTYATALFSGVNVKIVNGSGTTHSINGLGNLIVGYDEGRPSSAPHECEFSDCSDGQYYNPLDDDQTNKARCEGNNATWAKDLKTGSHNLVVGPHNNYSSYGGVVFGSHNTISKSEATVTGGRCNKATAIAASVSGGIYNRASSEFASVVGGQFNKATNNYSTVSGGQFNEATGKWASVSGGDHNKATHYYASVTGGRNNMATFHRATVSGGENNEASGTCASVSGGTALNASQSNCWKAGTTADSC